MRCHKIAGYRSMSSHPPRAKMHDMSWSLCAWMEPASGISVWQEYTATQQEPNQEQGKTLFGEYNTPPRQHPYRYSSHAAPSRMAELPTIPRREAPQRKQGPRARKNYGKIKKICVVFVFCSSLQQQKMRASFCIVIKKQNLHRAKRLLETLAACIITPFDDRNFSGYIPGPSVASRLYRVYRVSHVVLQRISETGRARACVHGKNVQLAANGVIQTRCAAAFCATSKNTRRHHD